MKMPTIVLLCASLPLFTTGCGNSLPNGSALGGSASTLGESEPTQSSPLADEGLVVSGEVEVHVDIDEEDPDAPVTDSLPPDWLSNDVNIQEPVSASPELQPDPTRPQAERLLVEPGISISQVAVEGTPSRLVQRIDMQYDAFSGERKTLFADTATFQEIESYRIRMQHLLEFSRDDYQLTVTNWVPRDLHNIMVVMNYRGKDYDVMHIDRLPGLKRFTIELPWVLGATVFQSLDGEIVDLRAEDTSSLEFSWRPQGDLQQRIANLGVNWNLSFPDRVMNGKADVCRDASVVWRPTRPQDARYLLSFMVNAAQTVSSPEFQEFWMKTPFQHFQAGRIPADQVLTPEELATYSPKEIALYNPAAVQAGQYYNKAHRAMVLDRYINKTFALGMTGGGGLGGGSTVGLNHKRVIELAWTFSEEAAEAALRGDWFLPVDSKAYATTPWNIFGHETGHALGFGHQQSYNVRSRFSHITVGTIAYSLLMAEGKTIVTPDTMVGRDLDWEKPYNKNADGPNRSRPRCGDAFEWGGAYERHDIQMPQKDTSNWGQYIDAHLNGHGLDYLRTLNLSSSTSNN